MKSGDKQAENSTLKAESDSVQTLVMQCKFKTVNEWFLSLPEGRQKVLRENKWMLADAAFEAAKILA